MEGSFDRKYELWITSSRELVSTCEVGALIEPVDVGSSKDYDEKDNLLEDAVDWSSIPVEESEYDTPLSTLVIKDLNIVAKITYSKEKSSKVGQDATIDIYNLSKENRDAIEDESLVVLKAGYATDEVLPLIFSGQIVYSNTEKSNSDVITHLVCADSYIPLKDKRVSMSFAGGEFTIREVLQTLLDEAKKIGISSAPIALPRASEESLVALRLGRKVSQGYVAEGSLFDEINNLCEQVGLVAYIEKNTLYIEPKAHHAKELVDIVKVEDVNVVGFVSAMNDSTTSGGGSKKAANGIKFKTFLDGRVVLANYVQIQNNPKFKALYETSKVSHTLEYEGTSWYTEVEARSLSSAE